MRVLKLILLERIFNSFYLLHLGQHLAYPIVFGIRSVQFPMPDFERKIHLPQMTHCHKTIMTNPHRVLGIETLEFPMASSALLLFWL
jgi:hypothetical protein